ncbi:MAG: right-handed parallel beta-helix repeat-containing protein [Planctomycetota bacterium]|nr:right-handed parallel beta-helix repeat-containing protein [Planctomycetota bacterium]
MMRTSRSILVILLVLSAPGSAQGQTTWHVDDDCKPPGTGTELDPFCTVQNGVDASDDGDTVEVRPGTYTGDGNRDISLFGKKIWLRSADGPTATILDIAGSPNAIHRGFFLIHGETRQTVIEGFMIRNGYLIGDTGGSGDGGGGGGFYLCSSSPTIRDCIVRDNISATFGNPFIDDGRGGGILVDEDSSALIENCVISGNHSGRRGGGMFVGYENSSVTIRGSLIAGNSSAENFPGGGIQNTFGSIIISNTTIVDNHNDSFGGGIYNEGGEAFLRNCILWDNDAIVGAQVYADSFSALTIEYSDVAGGLEGVEGSGEIDWGPGMIDADPLFIDAEKSDFRLLHGSLCIDAADNLAVPEGVSTDLDGDPRFLDDPTAPDTGNPDPDAPKLPIVDMGPYEYDPEDCNNNDIPDADDIANETSIDCDENAIPDDCEVDCNNNGQVDACDVTQGLSDDCNDNLIPDECELDCNDNGQQDDCDITDGSSDDCDTNGVPDECDPDCNDNGEVDACDIADGFSHDWDGDNVPDECDPGPPILEQPADAEVQAGDFVFINVQADGALLFYQWRKDGVDLTDTDRIIGTTLATLFILDVRPLDAGAYDCVVTDLFGPICTTSEAATLTVITDCPADFDNTGTVGPFDLANLLGNWGPNPNHPADLNNDDIIDAADLALLLGNWGLCGP